MSFWADAVAAADGKTEADFEQAADRLISEQVLYAADQRSKAAYALIRDYEHKFRQALAPFGYQLQLNRQLRYACAIPRHRHGHPATVAQTLLALVLRHIFDEETRSGHHDEHGEVACDLVTLTVKYQQITGREPESGGKLQELLRWMQRWGLARLVDDGGDYAGAELHQPYAVIIRPGIAEVLGETALLQLARFAEAGAITDEAADDNDDDDPTAGEDA